MSHVPPFEPGTGAASTGLPAELFALRLLVLAHSIPTLTSFDLKEPRKLDKAAELKLARAIYPDTPELAEAAGTLGSSLRSITEDGVTTIAWFDRDGVIFRVKTGNCTDGELAAFRKKFEWLPARESKSTLPRVSELVAYLIAVKVIDSKEGNVVAFGKDGARDSETIKDRTNITMELVRFRMGGQIGALTISRAGPLRVKDVKVLRDNDDKAIGRIATGIDVDDSKVLSLIEQDWVATIQFPGLNSGGATAKVVTEAEQWMRHYKATLRP
jgi:hypothetical protein